MPSNDYEDGGVRLGDTPLGVEDLHVARISISSQDHSVNQSLLDKQTSNAISFVEDDEPDTSERRLRK